MTRFLTCLLVLAGSVAASAANRAQIKAATDWITPVITAKGKPPSPTTKESLTVVFGGNAVPPGASCAKLRTASLTSEAELDQLTACVQTALHALQLDDPKLHDRPIDEGSLRWLQSWFDPKLKSKLVVPRGSTLVGKTIDRSIDDQGNGVALLIYLVIDVNDHVAAAYAYAGAWSYPT